jgi:hypothetical protein
VKGASKQPSLREIWCWLPPHQRWEYRGTFSYGGKGSDYVEKCKMGQIFTMDIGIQKPKSDIFWGIFRFFHFREQFFREYVARLKINFYFCMNFSNQIFNKT